MKIREEYFEKLGLVGNTYQSVTTSEKIKIFKDLLSISGEGKTVQILAKFIYLSESNRRMLCQKQVHKTKRKKISSTCMLYISIFMLS